MTVHARQVEGWGDRDGTRAVTPAELAERIAEWQPDARSALGALYGDRAPAVYDAVVARATAAAHARKPALVELDRRREREPDWYQRPSRVGYIAYADRFGGDLRGVAARIPYLVELGVNVFHLMSVLKPRAGDSDGGYALDDYRSPDPRLGTVADLEQLADELRAAGISLCLDFVMNHTSSTHEWALAARAGSAYHRALYRVFPDRALPDAYEATLPEIFPDLSPGSFTWDDDLVAWVWTTFRDFQWDLDWGNPDVLVEMLDLLLHLVNLGVEVVRLDAVAFTWKRLGTNSQNQPEAHLIVQALRAAVGMAAPSAILLAEAIVGPDDLLPYLGRHRRERRECELAYHNQLMVQGWSMLAAGGAALAAESLGRLAPPPSRATWFTYVRCHDDIGWAISDRDAAATGLNGFAHRRFLAAFYRGDYPGSFSRGVAFSSNPLTGDERTCGMTATLCGIEAAREVGDEEALALGIDRLLLLYAVAFGFGGIPMIYMGDELGQGDDVSYLADPHRAADSRWRQRPALDEDALAARHDPATVAGRIFAGMRRLVAARRACPPLHGAGTVRIVDTFHPTVLGWMHVHPRFGALLGLANVAAAPAAYDLSVLGNLDATPIVDLLAPDDRDLLHLAPYQVRWLTPDAVYRPIPDPGQVALDELRRALSSQV